MKVAVCIDDNNGMLFNSRRQSRDKELIADFVKAASGSRILIKPFSKILFDTYPVTIDESILETAEKDDYCFVEDQSLIPFSSEISELIIYRWNRNYPADFIFEMPEGFVLSETTDFKGSSHEKITKEIYKNER